MAGDEVELHGMQDFFFEKDKIAAGFSGEESAIFRLSVGGYANDIGVSHELFGDLSEFLWFDRSFGSVVAGENYVSLILTFHELVEVRPDLIRVVEFLGEIFHPRAR